MVLFKADDGKEYYVMVVAPWVHEEIWRASQRAWRDALDRAKRQLHQLRAGDGTAA